VLARDMPDIYIGVIMLRITKIKIHLRSGPKYELTQSVANIGLCVFQNSELHYKCPEQHLVSGNALSKTVTDC
jgi:hypothetical protein